MVLALAGILYVPADGRGDGIVGEEMLHWLNTFDKGESRSVPFGGMRADGIDTAPSQAEGNELSELARPWEHPNFWHYMHQYVHPRASLESS